MSAMIDFLDVLGVAAVPVLWLPLAGWTIVLGALLLLLRAFDKAHPLLRYRFAQGGLIVLPLGVVLAGTVALLPAEEAPVMVAVVASLPAITVGAAPMPLDVSTIEQQAISLWTAAGAATVLAILAALLGTGRLLADWLALRGLRRRLPTTEDTTVRAEIDVLRRRLKVRRDVDLHIAPGDVVPMTAGVIHPVIILPGSLEAAERRLVLAHELVHVRQGDVLGQWLERFVAALFAIHPGVHWLQRRCALLREMSCDAALVAEAQVDRRSYSDLLFSYADIRGRLLAPGMADRRSHIHQRISAMTGSSARFAPSRVATTAIIATVLFAGTLALAAPRLTEQRADASAKPGLAVVAGDTIFVVVEQMPVPVGGLEGIQERVRYPRLARYAGIEGTVFVQFVVNSDGSVSDLRCTRDPGAGTCEAAGQAIQETEFLPGRHRGEAVPVRFSLPVRFRLGEGRAPIGQQTAPQDSGDVVTIIDQMPEIVGGLESLLQRVRYPEEAKVAGVEGVVTVQVDVDESGHPTVIGCWGARIDHGLCEEAVRVVRETRFEPGRQDGRAVAARLSLPVRFTIDQPPPGEVDPDGMNPTVTTLSIDDEHVRVRGTVWRGQEALPGVSVRVVGTRIGAATDANGHYDLLIPIDLVGEVDRLSFDHPQHDAAEIRINEQLRVQRARWVAVLALEFDYVAQDEEGVTFRGRVTHRETGRPVADVHVTSVSPVAAVTDSAGRFELRVSPLPDASMFPVHAQHPDLTMFSRPLLYDLQRGDFLRREQVRPE